MPDAFTSLRRRSLSTPTRFAAYFSISSSPRHAAPRPRHAAIMPSGETRHDFDALPGGHERRRRLVFADAARPRRTSAADDMPATDIPADIFTDCRCPRHACPRYADRRFLSF